MPTGDYPCDVFTVLGNNCHTCHQSPPQNGAPFSLLTYEDTQADYAAGKKRWQRMKEVVEIGFMPLGSSLTDNDKQILLGWLEGCAQPAAEGMGCE
jgi:cytochrome c peroxidase